MDAQRLHAFARRRLADQPEECPCEPEDAALMLAWLSALEVEAELDEEAVEEAIAADRDERRMQMAAAFRQSSGRGRGNGESEAERRRVAEEEARNRRGEFERGGSRAAERGNREGA